MSVTLMTETNLYKDDAIADGLEDASKVATNYLSYNAQDGLTVGRTGQSERAVITSDGMEIYDGQNEKRAEFKAVTRLGEADKANLQLDYHSMQLRDMDGNTYMHVSDLRDDTGYATISEYFNDATESELPYLTLSHKVESASDVLSVKNRNGGEVIAFVNIVVDSSGVCKIYPNYGVISLPYDVTYKTTDGVVAFTLGNRTNSAEVGIGSFTCGVNLSAKKSYSQCIGSDSEANKPYSHVIGANCSAQGAYSCANGSNCSAVGDYSHAEGSNCSANEKFSYAFGSNCSADVYSHAEGLDCDAKGQIIHRAPTWETSIEPSYAFGKGMTSGANQFAFGTYNVGTTSDETIRLIVGGGNSSASKDACVLYASGNMTIAGTLTQSSDKRLKLHHAYLSDQEQDVNSFIESLKPAYFEKDQAKHLGFYAQDVQLSDKWNTMVSEDTNGFLALGYTEIIAPLVAYVQNQQKKIDSLEERIARLEQLINQQ